MGKARKIKIRNAPVDRLKLTRALIYLVFFSRILIFINNHFIMESSNICIATTTFLPHFWYFSLRHILYPFLGPPGAHTAAEKKECGRWKCIEAAGEEGFSQPRCVKVINRPSILASCSVAFSLKKTPGSAQSNAQFSARLRKLFEF